MPAKGPQTPKQREDAIADSLLNTAELGRELTDAAMEQALKEARAGKLKDAAATARNAAVTTAVAIDKRLVLQERPIIITGHRDPIADGLALLRKHGLTIPGTAEDITDAPELPPAA